MRKFYFAALLLYSPSLLSAQSFAPLVTYPVDANTFPSALAMGDMDGDGYVDIITSNAGPNEPAVLLNKKNGTFGAATLYDGTAHSVLQDVAVGDITKDGRPDAVVLDYGGTLSLMYNARGGLSRSLQYTVDDKAVAVKLGDVDNDGYLDAVTASLGRSASFNTDLGMVNVLLNTKRNTFATATPYPTSSFGSPYDVDLGDVNGDGYLDIVTAFREGTMGVSFNKKDGTFAPFTLYATGSSTHPENVVLRDVNKDGALDILATDRTRDVVEVLLNKTDGTFLAARSYPMGSGSRPEGFAAADMDGDGYADIVTANFGTNTLGISRNNRDGTFAPVVLLSTGSGSQPTDVALSDVNKDGKLDIVVTNYNSTIGILINNTVLATQAGAAFPPVQATIYPNPARHAATLKGATANTTVNVYNTLGNLVLTTQTNAMGTALLALPGGLYLVRSGTGPALRLTVE
jgi:hypothetical protein